METKYVIDPDMPIPLLRALQESNQGYYEELREYLSEQDNKKFKISTTALLKPTQATVLFSRHRKDIWVHPEKDCWHSMKGSTIHFILEKAAAKDPRYLTEVRVGVDLEIDGEMVHVHGKLDLYDQETQYIEDWKLTSPTSMAYDKADHRMQLNILYYLMRKNGYSVKGLRDIYLFERLDPTKKNYKDYPTKHYQKVDVEIMPMSDIKKFIIKRVRALKAEHAKSDKKLTQCTDDERWIRGTTYKLYPRTKAGHFSKYASDTAATREEIVAKVVEKGLSEGEFEIRELKGLPKACEYCSVATVCRQRIKEVLLRDKAEQEKQ